MSNGSDNDDSENLPDFPATNSLEQGLRRVIDYHCAEFDLSYATLIGVLEMIQASIMDQWMHGPAVEDENEGEDDDLESES